MRKISLVVVFVCSIVSFSAPAYSQGCTYLGGYPWKTGGCLVADDLNNAIASRNPFLNFSTKPKHWISGFNNGEPVLTQPSYADLAGSPIGQIPPPASSSLGGVYSSTAPANQFFYSLNTQGEFASRQASFLDISGIIASTQIPSPTAISLGGVKSFTAPTGSFISGVTTSGDYTTGTPTIQFTGTETPGGLKMVCVDSTTTPAQIYLSVYGAC